MQSLNIFWLYAIMSILAFITYARDKSAAVRQQRRVPENTLHLLAFAGGWPGALLAQKMLRHKTKKTSFLVVFYMTIVMNLLAFNWVFKPFA